MRLSKNFVLEEFIRSETASRYNFFEQFDPPKEVVDNLQLLVNEVLQPLRTSVNKSIRITSGYRCPRLNRQIGGAVNSDHPRGNAADIVGGAGVSNATLFRRVIDLKLPFDQLIWEFGTDVEPQWVHVSHSPRNRRQILQAKRIRGKVVYTSMS